MKTLMQTSQPCIGLRILLFGTILIQGIFSGNCVSSKGKSPCVDPSGSASKTGPEHEGTIGDSGENKAGDASASGLSDTLMTTQVEFIIEQTFTVFEGDESCQDRCWREVFNYRSRRAEYTAPPPVHHHCNLGWIQFGWRTLETSLPKHILGEPDWFEDLFKRDFKNLEQPMEKGDPEASLRILAEVAILILDAVARGDTGKSSLPQVPGHAFHHYSNKKYPQNEKKNTRDPDHAGPIHKASPPTCYAGGTSEYTCHREYQFPTSFSSAIEGMTRVISDYCIYVKKKLQGNTQAESQQPSSSGSQASSSKEPHHWRPHRNKGPKQCRCQIAVVVNHFLYDRDIPDPMCNATAFAELFSYNQGSWYLVETGKKLIDQSEQLQAFPGANNIMKFNAMKTEWYLWCRHQTFFALASEMMGEAFPRPSGIPDLPVTDEEKEYFGKQTSLVYWLRTPKFLDTMATREASDQEPGPRPPVSLV
ncbi:hypothetical protein BCR37DRAFT_379750 [Protomyces lactucae-debilis]|uniref:Uncharacterized protein n=1 Tax=Protomyces lactucae-debilis TaxID=2754530 RepID=A0A1Y2FIT0_PROLT|nr:uncharacterized protein BCR37DRAFT_379750 [Protomyces lactucae-debilis]ORY82715.1 hypothetical protein BCR37DRAFT_379750 [Protomyces lactucae-debilis]